MEFGPRLPRAFYARPCVQVARELIGCVIVHRLPDARLLAGRIVEVEAYLGDGTDPGSHSHGGQTRRNRSMFGPAGRLYTYRSYGIHTCANVVCEAEGTGAAVLLRAAAPLAGAEWMRRHRGLGAAQAERSIASGPGRLAQAFALGLEHDGASLLRGPIGVYAGRTGTPEPDPPVAGPRVGLTRGTELPYRFHAAADPHVSPWRPGRRRVRRD